MRERRDGQIRSYEKPARRTEVTSSTSVATEASKDAHNKEVGVILPAFADEKL
jgi:hypothetical protein